MNSLEVEIIEKKQVTKADLGWGSITHRVRSKSDSVTISTPEFSVRIDSMGIVLEYLIHRPGHDHNNSPSIRFKLPEGGKVTEYKGTGNATLTVEDDAGHLMLDMKYDNYVWERGMELVIKKHEYDRLRNFAKNRGVDALLERIGYKGD